MTNMEKDSIKERLLMTDKEFSKYLFKLLMNSGEDCCSKCAHCSKTKLCDNLNANQGGILDDDICYNGMYEYATNEEKKPNEAIKQTA